MNLTRLENLLASEAIHPVYLKEVDSTNSYLLSLAAGGAPEWTVVCADMQTAGRGRYHRQWYSAAEKGLYFSLLLRPRIPVRYINLINLFCALQLSLFLEKKLREFNCTAEISLKWPNDVYVSGKKLCGILLEGSFSDKTRNTLVIGIGINLQQHAGDWPEEIRAGAISLGEIHDASWNREELLSGFINLIYKKYYEQFPHKMGEIVDLYWKRVLYKHQEVHLRIGDESRDGIFSGLTPEGYMRLLADGEEQIITTGELFLL